MESEPTTCQGDAAHTGTLMRDPNAMLGHTASPPSTIMVMGNLVSERNRRRHCGHIARPASTHCSERAWHLPEHEQHDGRGQVDARTVEERVHTQRRHAEEMQKDRKGRHKPGDTHWCLEQPDL